jgi:hypothetical protein
MSGFGIEDGGHSTDNRQEVALELRGWRGITTPPN